MQLIFFYFIIFLFAENGSFFCQQDFSFIDNDEQGLLEELLMVFFKDLVVI
jgi:hypothetical protein